MMSGLEISRFVAELTVGPVKVADHEVTLQAAQSCLIAL